MENQQAGNQKRQREAASLWDVRRPEIERLYVIGTWSQAQLADRYGITQQAMAKVLARMGVPSKSRARAGWQNGRFKDGSESTAYRLMIEKDACARCGTVENLCVHHMDGDHGNNIPSNLQVMCMSCHTSMHKSEWWASRKASAS